MLCGTRWGVETGSGWWGGASRSLDAHSKCDQGDRTKELGVPCMWQENRQEAKT